MSKSSAPIFTPVLIVGCILIVVSFAVRGAFGVFQIPIAEEFGWLRYEFSLAIAIQNLAWGIGQPIFGAISEKIGDRKAIIFGAILYAAGLVLSAWSTTPLEHQSYAWLIGFGVAGVLGLIQLYGSPLAQSKRKVKLGILLSPVVRTVFKGVG